MDTGGTDIMTINLEELDMGDVRLARLQEMLERLEGDCRDMQYRGKPELAEEEWGRVMCDIHRSFVSGCRISIRTWDPFGVEEVRGVVKIVNTKPLQVKLELEGPEERFRWIWMAHILDTST
jgi:hypothetical protein